MRRSVSSPTTTEDWLSANLTAVRTIRPSASPSLQTILWPWLYNWPLNIITKRCLLTGWQEIVLSLWKWSCQQWTSLLCPWFHQSSEDGSCWGAWSISIKNNDGVDAISCDKINVHVAQFLESWTLRLWDSMNKWATIQDVLLLTIQLWALASQYILLLSRWHQQGLTLVLGARALMVQTWQRGAH